MTIDEQIAVMTAFKNGAKIQTKCTTLEVWVDDETPLWNFKDCNYRVRPSGVNDFLEFGKEYWFVDRNCVITANFCGGFDRSQYTNVFETEAEANRYYELEKAKLRVKNAIAIANKDVVLDFNCNDTPKYFIYINGDSWLELDYIYTYKALPSWLYIANKSCAIDIMKEHKDDLLLILGE